MVLGSSPSGPTRGWQFCQPFFICVMYYTYILYSKSLDSYYIGSSKDVYKRLERHNRGHSKYTKRGIPWEMVYFKEYPSRSEAVKREYQLKKQKSRSYIEQLIAKG